MWKIKLAFHVTAPQCKRGLSLYCCKNESIAKWFIFRYILRNRHVFSLKCLKMGSRNSISWTSLYANRNLRICQWLKSRLASACVCHLTVGFVEPYLCSRLICFLDSIANFFWSLKCNSGEFSYFHYKG